ncbi:MAG: FtsX-like permease family protein [Gemmatimonadota bacterium]|nr:FtsX-like permease family protein [Gemmatimonadota bacterium]
MSRFLDGHAGVLGRLALRNVRRQGRRSILTSLAMVVGIGLLVFSRSMADGGHEDWIDAGVRLGSGHVTIQSPDFATRRTLAERLSPTDLEAALAAVSDVGREGGILETATRLEVRGLASSPGGALPVVVAGVEPDVESRFSQLDERLIDGEYLPDGDELAAFVGVDLAERLDLQLGSRLVLTGQDAAGDISGQLVRVRGIFRSGLPEVDTRIVHVRLGIARDWLGAEGSATSVALLLESSSLVDRSARRLGQLLADVPGADVLTWPEAMPELEAAVRMDDFGDYVFHIITLIIVALAVINTILMSVLNRTREFGVTRALGMTRRDTGAQVMIEGVLLSAVSGFVGIVLGLAVTWVFFRNGLDFSGLMENGMEAAGVIIDPVIYPKFRLPTLLGSVGFVFAIGVGASIYPAYRATRIEVAEAMKFEA